MQVHVYRKKRIAERIIMTIPMEDVPRIGEIFSFQYDDGKTISYYKIVGIHRPKIFHLGYQGDKQYTLEKDIELIIDDLSEEDKEMLGLNG